MTTNPTLDLIRSHGSARHYKPDSVPVDMIETIVDAGQRASSSSNLQTYSVIAVTDETKRQRLSELCNHQRHIAEAPVFLTFCADLARLDFAATLRGYTQNAEYLESFLVSAVDAALVAQNTALAAESLGLGICYIGSIRNNPFEVIELLGLPNLVFPITGMTIGWPEFPPRIRPRLPQREILHWEHHHATEKAALKEYDQAMIATGIYKGRQVMVPGKPDEMEEYGWTEHSARRVSSAVRESLSDMVKKQGFGLK